MAKLKEDFQLDGHGRSCETCIFFTKKNASYKPNLTHVEIGRCRRHAPISGQGFPTTLIDSWCGDHKLDENKI